MDDKRREFQRKRTEAIQNDPELREAERERLRIWAANNREKERERSKRRYAANKEYYKRIRAAWWKAHPEKAREYYRKKRALHGDREREQDRAWYAANKEKVAEKDRKRRNGPNRPKILKLLRYAQHKHYLSREKYEEIYPRLEEGPCEICGMKSKMKIDHCHEKMVFRGIICDGCNRGLGYFHDNPVALRAAAEYLER